MKRCLRFIFALGLFMPHFLQAESEGEKLFKSNEPNLAVEKLEQEIKEGIISADTYNFLGLAYFQIGDYESSISAFERGMKAPTANRRLLLFNEGNVAYEKGDFSKAESCYSLALAASPDFYKALLNRAGSRLMAEKYAECLEDYKKYVEVVPEDPQNPEIRRLIAYLEQELVRQKEEAERLAEEQRRLEEENRRLQEELARQEAERLAKEEAERAIEEERRKKLLEEVANSLLQTDTTNMTAGAEDVLDYEYESELE